MEPGAGRSRVRLGMAIEDRLWDRGWTCRWDVGSQWLLTGQ